jgi:hypothetical protein
MPLFERITDFHAGAEVIRRRRYGMIEMAEGRLVAVHLRPWPKLISLGEIWLEEMVRRSARSADRCFLYYDQPLRCPTFLAVKYIVTSWGATFCTARGACLVLDEIARIKQIDAIVCDAWNRRISDRLLRRWGWERHMLHSRRRHYIKRFYGHYPENPDLDRYLDPNPKRQRGPISRNALASGSDAFQLQESEPGASAPRLIGDVARTTDSPSPTFRLSAPELALLPGGTQEYYPAPAAPWRHEQVFEELSPCD